MTIRIPVSVKIWADAALELNYLGLHCPHLSGDSFYQVKPLECTNRLLAPIILKAFAVNCLSDVLTHEFEKSFDL